MTVIINKGLWTLRSLILLSLFTFAPALTSAAVPIPSSITASSIGPTSATVTWTTDVPSTSQIEYGLTTAYGSRTRKDMALVTAHSLPMVGLSQNTLYHLRVLSDDSSGGASVSGDITFTTLPPSSCAPAPTNPQVLDVRSYGATGNGSTDDTVAIQNAINAVVSGGTVLVPAGTYMMNTARIPGPNIALQLKSNMTFKMAAGAILKAMPSSADGYRVINIEGGISNISIVGGTVLGERGQHIGSTGEHGMGIAIYGGQNIFIDGVTAKDLWGDGFIVSYASSGITMCNVVADNNRRQGLSIVDVNGMTVRDSVFKNTNGTAPQAGIDIEPDAGRGTNNVTITGSQFLDNVGGGISVFGYNGSYTNFHPITNTTIANNFVRHRDVGLWLQGIRSGATVSGNITQPGVNASYGIYLTKTLNSTISNNSIINPGWDGIRLETGSNSNTVSGNYVEGSSQNWHATWANISLSHSGFAGDVAANANIIKCNVLRDGALANKPSYAINVETSSVTNTQLLTNNANSGYFGTIKNNGVGTVISTDPANCPSASPPPPSCTPTPLNVSGVVGDGGFAYVVAGPFGTPADNSTSPTQSLLRFFENGIAMGPAHSASQNIRDLGAGRFSHWFNGAAEALFFSASNNSDPRTNEASYAYCVPDTTPPATSITAPTAGATVSGSAVTVSANASDNVGVAGVQFKLDGASLGAEDTTAPYSVVWNTTTATNASHTLTAVARDAAGNTTTSASVSVTVNNATSCSPTPLTVSTATSDGGFAYMLSLSFGTPADNSNSPVQSTLRFFENGLALGPPHSVHADIRNLGQGRFSHWSVTNGTGESLRFAASDNTDPRINGRSYAYCTPAALLAPGRLRLSLGSPVSFNAAAEEKT